MNFSYIIKIHKITFIQNSTIIPMWECRTGKVTNQVQSVLKSVVYCSPHTALHAGHYCKEINKLNQIKSMEQFYWVHFRNRLYDCAMRHH